MTPLILATGGLGDIGLAVTRKFAANGRLVAVNAGVVEPAHDGRGNMRGTILCLTMFIASGLAAGRGFPLAGAKGAAALSPLANGIGIVKVRWPDRSVPTPDRLQIQILKGTSDLVKRMLVRPAAGNMERTGISCASRI